MKFDEKTFIHLRKKNTIFNSIAVLFGIAAIVFLPIGSVLLDNERIPTAFIFLGLCFAFVFLTMATVSLKAKHLLKFVGLKKFQRVFVVNHRGLSVTAVDVTGIDPWDTHCTIKTDFYTAVESEHIYPTRKEADKALQSFIDDLYKNVTDYIGFEGVLSRTDHEEIISGYKKFLAKNQYQSPTGVKAEDLVTFMVAYRQEQKVLEAQKEAAKNTLKDEFMKK